VTRRAVLGKPPVVSGESDSAQGEVTTIDHPLIRVKLTQMRDATTSSQEFRSRLAEVATLMVYEVTRTLETQPLPVRTPLATCDGAVLRKPLVVAPILRAGLGMVEGILWLLPDVSVAHIGMYRNEETRRPESYYFKAPPNLADANVLLVDPMLATGWSATAAISQLKENGAASIRFVCLVTCPAGIRQLHSAHPEVPIYTASIDSHLDDRAYIVPGLGDAGDRYFGTTAI
jgi:uracil phosphoribosyltransferase